MSRSSQTSTSSAHQTVVCARVPSKEQEREGYSIDAQLKFLRQHASEKGLKVVSVFQAAELDYGAAVNITGLQTGMESW